MKELVRRYESERASGRLPYLDTEEFEQLADHYLYENELGKVDDLLRHAATIHPLEPSLELRRAEWLLAQGRPDETLAILDKLPQGDEDVRIVRGSAWFAQGHRRRAIKRFRELVDETRDDRDLLCLDLGDILMYYGEFEECLRLMDQGIAVNPSNTELYEMATECCEKLESWERSLPYYDRLLDEDPYDSAAWMRLGGTYYNLGRFEESLKAYDFASVALPKPTAELFVLQAHSLVQLRRYRQAQELYEKALPDLTSDLDRNDACGCAAECFEKLQEYDKAVEWYRQALAYDPADAQAFLGLGVCYMELQRYDQSLAAFEEALKSAPDNYETWLYLGDLYARTERYGQALSAYQCSLDQAPLQPEVLYAVGNLYFQQRDYRTALVYYAKSANLDENQTNLPLMQAVASAMLGQRNEAEYYLKKALVQQPDARRLYKQMLAEERGE